MANEKEGEMYILKRDGKEIMRGTEIEIWQWIHSNCSYSVDHATRFEGYSIERERKDNTRRNARARERRAAIAEAYKSCGMKQVRSASGKEYWE